MSFHFDCTTLILKLCSLLIWPFFGDRKSRPLSKKVPRIALSEQVLIGNHSLYISFLFSGPSGDSDTLHIEFLKEKVLSVGKHTQNKCNTSNRIIREQTVSYMDVKASIAGCTTKALS